MPSTSQTASPASQFTPKPERDTTRAQASKACVKTRPDLKKPRAKVKPASDLSRPWLTDFDWLANTETNAGLCASTSSFHGPTSDGHADCKASWESKYREVLSFREALDFLQSCHRMAPFCFNNGNTFAAVARDLVYDMTMDARSASLLRSAAAHYVAGVLPGDELDTILSEIVLED